MTEHKIKGPAYVACLGAIALMVGYVGLRIAFPNFGYSKAQEPVDSIEHTVVKTTGEITDDGSKQDLRALYQLAIAVPEKSSRDKALEDLCLRARNKFYERFDEVMATIDEYRGQEMNAEMAQNVFEPINDLCFLRDMPYLSSTIGPNNELVATELPLVCQAYREEMTAGVNEIIELSHELNTFNPYLADAIMAGFSMGY